MSLHTCPASGCTKRMPARTLMCRDHWRAVPRQLQDEVNRTWFALQAREQTGDVSVDRQNVITFYRAYMTARKAAIDAVNAQLAQEVHP